MKKIIGVFGPSGVAANDHRYQEAEALGSRLAAAGYAIVSGGYEGVMEAASKGARNAGGTVIGVTAEVFFARGREANEYLTREVRVKSAVDALMELIDIPDAYLAIGNSTGTAVEILFAWDYIIKRFIEPKPIILIGASWERFREYVIGDDQFLPYLHLVRWTPNIDGALGHLLDIFGPQLMLPDLTILH